MISAGLHVLFYALIAAASPLALTATLVVIRSDRPRTNGIAFLTGYLIGTAVACIVGLFVGSDGRCAHRLARVTRRGRVDDPARCRARHGRTENAGRRLRSLWRSGSSRSARRPGQPRPRAARSRSVDGSAPRLRRGRSRLLLTFLAMAAVTGAGRGYTGCHARSLYIGVGTALVSVPSPSWSSPASAQRTSSAAARAG